VAEEGPQPPRIVVAGVGTVRTAPDAATLTFNVRGEGPTADAASRALVERREAIKAGIASLVGSVPLRTSDLSLTEARDKACQGEWQEGGRLSQGECAVRGYIANMDATVRISTVDKAGTLTGLVARLGGSDVRLSGFGLTDETEAKRKAMTAAFADARAQAEAIAAGAGVRLGTLYYVNDNQAPAVQEIEVTASRAEPVPSPLVTPPVLISVEPSPVETTVRLNVTYTIAP